jgi:chaperonin GroEL
MKDKKLHFEGTFNATRAVVEEDTVIGGVSMFVHLAENLIQWTKLNLRKDELVGAVILAKALTTSLSKIAGNAGKNGFLVIEKINQKDFTLR